MKKYILCFLFLFFSISNFSQENDKIARLEEKLSEIYEADQSVRKSIGEINAKYADSPEFMTKMDSIVAVMKDIDAYNQQYISVLLNTQGWLSGLSPQGNMTIFLVIQHGTAEYMKKYAPLVEQAYTDGKVTPSLYAIFKDRILMYANKPQVYGSQIVDGYIWPVEDSENLDEKRKSMGLPPMEEYLKTIKDGGANVVWDESMTIEVMKAKMGVIDFF